MLCKNCGKELLEGARFCAACGTPAEETPVAEGSVTEETPAAEGPAVAVAEPEAAPAKKKSGGKKAVLVCVAAVALAVALGVLLYLFQRFSGGEGRTPVYAYLTGEGELMLLPDLKEKTKALEVTDDGVAWVWTDSVQFSRDGRSVYFLSGTDDGADLYRATLSQLKKGERADRIVRDVEYFQVLDDDNVIYWNYDGEWGEALGLFDGQESDILCRECQEFALGEDGTGLYYRDGDGTLYRYDPATGGEEALLEDADFFLTSVGAETPVYTVYENSADEDGNYYAIYVRRPGQEPEKLAGNVCGYFTSTSAKVENGKVQVDYTTQRFQEATLYDFVNDPGDGELEALTEPDYDAYLVWDVDYSAESGTWRYLTYADVYDGVDNAVWREADVSQLLTGGLPIEELSHLDVQNLAQEGLEAEYEEKLTAWNAAIRRDQLRQTLKDQDYTTVSYDLYRCVDGTSQLVAADVSRVYGQDGVYLYQKAPSQGKVAELDDLSLDNYYETIESALRPGQWYQNVNGVESPIDLGQGVDDVTDLYLLDGGDVVVEAYREDYTFCLLSFTVEGDGLKASGVLDERETSAVQVLTTPQGGKALYFIADVADGDFGSIGTLVRFQDGRREELLRKVSNAWVAPDGRSGFAVVQGKTGKAQLVRFRDGESVTVADALSTAADRTSFALCGENVLYLDENDRLYAWNGKDARRLAKNVEAVWANGGDDYIQIW